MRCESCGEELNENREEIGYCFKCEIAGYYLPGTLPVNHIRVIEMEEGK
ncbi:MAG: hypothetical protein KKA19_09010 [Candidatus Margulisbacteria bacterium]|nr:hypothetical protein [Candidatus Margulisiibacteriota bacterium]